MASEISDTETPISDETVPEGQVSEEEKESVPENSGTNETQEITDTSNGQKDPADDGSAENTPTDVQTNPEDLSSNTVLEDWGQMSGAEGMIQYEFYLPELSSGMSKSMIAAGITTIPAGLPFEVILLDAAFVPIYEEYTPGTTLWLVAAFPVEQIPASVWLNDEELPVLDEDDTTVSVLANETSVTYDAEDSLVEIFVYCSSADGPDVEIQLPELYEGMTSAELSAGIQTTPDTLILSGCSFQTLEETQEAYDPTETKIIELTYEISQCQSSLTIAGESVTVETNILALYDYDFSSNFQWFEMSDYSTMYLGGFANHHQIEFIKLLISDNPEVQYCHFGDIDVGGFLIFEDLSRKIGKPFIPYTMGIEELQDSRFTECLQPLTDSDRKRAEKLSDCFIGSNVIEYMLTNNVKLEQEIIGYYIFNNT